MIEKIEPAIKNYAWGGYDYLAELFSLKKNGQPKAEAWLGIHPAGEATLLKNKLLLSHWLQSAELEKINFLLKILDVKDMLSIQVHPNKEEAKIGFEKENRQGIPVDAFNRTYKDANHKPELILALSDFYLINGFDKAEAITERFDAIPSFGTLARFVEEHGIKDLFNYIIQMPQEEVNAHLKPLGKEIKPLYESGKLSKNDYHFWAARAFITYNKKGICDRGIFLIYMMNLEKLSPGESVFTGAGTIHAYMEGQCVEIMANSDNVIRGGLTPKYVDIEALKKHTIFESNPPDKTGNISATNQWQQLPDKSEEFDLAIVRLEKGHEVSRKNMKVQILLFLEGEGELIAEGKRQSVRKGNSFVIPPATSFSVKADQPIFAVTGF